MVVSFKLEVDCKKKIVKTFRFWYLAQKVKKNWWSITEKKVKNKDCIIDNRIFNKNSFWLVYRNAPTFSYVMYASVCSNLVSLYHLCRSIAYTGIRTKLFEHNCTWMTCLSIFILPQSEIFIINTNYICMFTFYIPELFV